MMADVLVVEGGRPLRGIVRVPGDKSISHRALLLAALASGRSTITGLSAGDDVSRTAAAVRSMGVGIGRDGGAVVVDGGLGRLHEPDRTVDVGNSGTGIRLLAGWCAPRPWTTVLAGDESIARRPMERVIAPLREMGASIEGSDGGRYPPLVVRGGSLRGIDYTLPVASAQVKGAVLLAALGARGATTVREQVGRAVRAHTEELLLLAGADVDVADDGAVVRVRGGAELRPFTLDVPGDPSAAAFWIVAACIVPGSEIVVENVYVGRARAGFLDVLRRMGAAVDIVRRPSDPNVADISARHAPLVATDVGGSEVPSLIDEIPVLAVAAACATGRTGFRDAGELTVKESNRIATVASELGAFGLDVEPGPDSLIITGRARDGGRPKGGGDVDIRSHGDHRIAMAMAVAALATGRTARIEGWSAVATSYPGFESTLESLCA